MATLRVLFLGAGKRLSLLQAFDRAAAAEGIALSMISVELTARVPIAGTADILRGPSFADPVFGEFLIETARDHRIDMVIPNMDSATVALANAKAELASIGCRAVVSDAGLCAIMLDKKRSAEWFAQHDMPQPGLSAPPWIIKHRRGYGARDQAIARSAAQRDSFLSGRNVDDYITQDFVEGPEYTIDAYVARSGRVVAALSRKRIEVLGGEVDVSETMRHKGALDLAARALAMEGWEGPITLQVIDGPNGPVMIEINPRFGGGVTHSIHCGLDMPRWLMREHRGLSLPDDVPWPDNSLMTRARMDVFHDH